MLKYLPITNFFSPASCCCWRLILYLVFRCQPCLDRQLEEQRKTIEFLTQKLQVVGEDNDCLGKYDNYDTTGQQSNESFMDLEFRLTQAEVINKTLHGEMSKLLGEKDSITEKLLAIQKKSPQLSESTNFYWGMDSSRLLLVL